MATGEPNLYADFSGGINLMSGPYLLKESECRDARNVHSTPTGSILKRPGMVSVLDDSTPLLGGAVHSLAAVNVSTPVLLGVGKQASASSDRIVKITGGGVVTEVDSGLTEGARWEFVQGPESGGQGPIYGLNGEDAAFQWDGVTGSPSSTAWTASTGTVPNDCRILVYHLDKFWASGEDAYPGRIYSTGVDVNGYPDPRNWDTDYIDHVDPADGQPITAIGKFGTYLLVFKAHKTYALSDPANRAYRTVNTSIGCSAHRSVVETSDGTFFLSEDAGVCVTDGTTVTPISDRILPFLREAADANATNFSKACASFHRGSYFLSIPYEDSENDITLEYQLDTKSWWIHTCAVNQFALLDPSGAPKLYSASSQAKDVCEAFVEGVYSDADTQYPDCYWEGPFWPWGMPHLNKRISQFRADGEGTWDTYASPAFNTDYELLEELVWETDDTGTTFGGTGTFGGDEFGPAAGITERRYYTPGQGWGRSWSLRVVSDNPSPLEVFSISGFARPRAD